MARATLMTLSSKSLELSSELELELGGAGGLGGLGEAGGSLQRSKTGPPFAVPFRAKPSGASESGVAGGFGSAGF
jgi:hypothetical protein